MNFKEKYIKERAKGLIVLFFAFAMTYNVAWADDHETWKLVTDNGISVGIDRVNCLVAADHEETFCVVLHDGAQISQVKYVTFSREVPNTISSPQVADYMIMANGTLRFEQLPQGSQIYVYSMTGTRLLSQTVNAESASTLDVSNLSRGTYIVKTAKGSFKFFKK